MDYSLHLDEVDSLLYGKETTSSSSSSSSCATAGIKYAQNSEFSKYFKVPKKEKCRIAPQHATIPVCISTTDSIGGISDLDGVFQAKMKDVLVQTVEGGQESNDIDGYFPVKDWGKIADRVDPHRHHLTSRDCFIRYRQNDATTINKSAWSIDEDKKLAILVAKYDECGWVTIADELGTKRTPIQCLQRYQQSLNMKMVNSADWSIDEDMMLKKAVEVHGSRNWQLVANMMNTGRSATQCGQRWRKGFQLREDVVAGHWSEQDERMLFLSAIMHEVPTSTAVKKSHEEIEAFLTDTSGVNGPSDSSMVCI